MFAEGGCAKRNNAMFRIAATYDKEDSQGILDGVSAKMRVGRVFVPLAFFCVCFGSVGVLAGCAAPFTDETSPQVSDVELTATSSMTEESQAVEIRIAFDQNVTIKDSVASDFILTVDGTSVDTNVISVQTRTSANTLTFVLSPAAGAGTPTSGSDYFALYESSFELSAARDDGLIPSITGVSGACIDLAEPIWGTLPSGLAIEVTEVIEGSVAENTLAKTVFRVTSPALVRAITWFSVDGGQTLLLKHNHTFSDADISDCAEDLALVVNRSNVGINAVARGDTVDLTATTVVDGQIIEPVVVEGVSVAGGEYDPSEDEF